MLDIIKKSIYLGLGIASTSKEKVEILVDELIEKGELAKEKKPAAVREILNKLEESENEFKKKTNTVVTQTLHNLGYATQKDIEELKRRVSHLEGKNKYNDVNELNSLEYY